MPPVLMVLRRVVMAAGVAVVLTLCLFRGIAATPPTVSLVVGNTSAKPIQHGLAKLKLAFQQTGVALEEVDSVDKATAKQLLVVGLSSNGGEVATLSAAQNLTLPTEPESLFIRKIERGDRSIILVTGGDARGLMYALLDIADRVGWANSAAQPCREVHDSVERPYTSERALSLYTFNRAYWESRFYDERYWERYLDLLAQNRFDSLVIIFGYENGGFLAPCYPYFFDVASFPGVRMVGMTADQQQRNLDALNWLIQMAHDRGIKLTVGIWDHIYRGGVQGGGIPGADDAVRRPTPGLVWGLTADNLLPYTKAALAEFVKRIPALDGIQFRMHDESGLKNSEQESFWHDVFQRMKSEAPQLRLDLRAKGLPDSVVQSAEEIGVPFRITTKYWMEQMGLPFHPTHINKQNQFDRRHSYADLLRFPQHYRIHWRLWNGGTTRVLLWGDPAYVRRFAESTHLYAGDGFEVNEPLCTKMEAQPHDAPPFDLLTPAHRYYQYEFERYWHFFQLFGRLGYNTNTPPEVWEREFDQRFGKDAAPFLEQGLHQASWVLPRIVASCYPYSAFPMTRGWAEKQRLGDLPAYSRAEGSDIQQFASFDEEAQILLQGGETAKLRPGANSRWFTQRATSIAAAVTEAEKHVGEHRNKEFESTITDLRILSNLALFHARRIPAAISYRLFDRTKNPQNLEDAIAAEQEAIEAWRQLVTAAGDFYNDDLQMGVRTANLCGHWKDELSALQKGLTALQTQRRKLELNAISQAGPRFPSAASAFDDAPPVLIHRRITSALAGQPLTVTADVPDPAALKWVHLRYRSVNQHQDYRTVPMLPVAGEHQVQATIPPQDIPSTWDLMYFIESMDKDGRGRIYPDLNDRTPYVVVRLER